MERLIFVFLVSAFNPLVITLSPSEDIGYKRMSGCERALHVDCVLIFGTKNMLKTNCDASKLQKCLLKYRSQSVCSVEDPDTIPTIDELIKTLNRRFKRNKRCATEGFLHDLIDYFKVLGESIENTEPRNLSHAGSGDENNDDDDDDDDDDDEGSTVGSGEDTVLIWRNAAKEIENGRQPGLGIYFDYKPDHDDPDTVEWTRLLLQYKRWERNHR